MEVFWKQTIGILAAAAIVAAGAYGDPIAALTLFPSGTVSGAPGTVVGWGYDVTNSSTTDYVILNDSFVTGGLATGTFGNYVDYIASNFIVIDPSSSTGDVAFSQGSAGTGEFDIDNFVPPVTIPGQINIDYSVFSQNPNDPTFDPGSFVTSGTLFAGAQVNVVPEPATVALTCFALLPLAFRSWRRFRTRRS